MKKILVFGLVMLLWVSQAFAMVSFEAGVNVSKEAENAAQAKDEAMKEAYREAFLKVASRLTEKENLDKLNLLTDDQLMHFISETTVVSEKSGGSIYRADLNVKINGELLTEYLKENHMFKAVSGPSRILIVPAYSDTAYQKKVLWENANIWRLKWLDKGVIKTGDYEFFIVDDTADNKALITFDALNDKQTYEKLVSLNNTPHIFYVQAVRAGRNNLILIIRSLENGQEQRALVTDQNGDPFDQGIEQSVLQISKMLDSVETDEENVSNGQVEAVFYYTALKEWLKTEQRLKNVEQVTKVETKGMGGGKVKLLIEYTGSLQSLKEGLIQNNLSLSNENGLFILK